LIQKQRIFTLGYKYRVDQAKVHSVDEQDYNIRTAKSSDHPRIISVMPNWWDGRDLRPLLPRLFLKHFCDTSFIIEKENELIGFLIGFLSQSIQDEAYIHFVGIHPDFRRKGLGKTLYRRFFNQCPNNGRTLVRACTSPINKDSIEFHQRMGFQIEPGDGQIDSIPVTLDYNCPGDHKVLFMKWL